MTMTILIENADTLEFLTRDGRWTKHAGEAATYRTSTLAKEFGTAAPIGRFNVVGAFKNSPQLTNLDEGCGISVKEGAV
jgi:hypothetical protein